MLNAFCLFLVSQRGELARVFFDSLGICRTVDELPLPSTINQAGFRQNSKVVRDRGWCDPTKRDNLPTGHVLARTDGLKDAEAGFIGKSPGDALDLLSVH